MQNRIGGKAFIIVGATGSGKSTLIKSLIKPVPLSCLHIYDVNAEYFPRAELPRMEDFLKKAKTLKETVMIFEEATIFFSNRGSNKEMRELLVRKRHAQNCIILVFHSIRYIPFYIYDLCNLVFVFRTNDSDDLVISKHEILLKAHRKAQKKFFVYGKKVLDYCEIVKLN